MRTFSRTEILEAAEEEQGVCLACGRRQAFLETRLILGLCHFCDEQQVLDAEVLARALTFVEDDS